MKFISWNVNGLRAVAGKGFADIFVDLDADFFCLQETKMQPGQLDLEFPGYTSYWNSADKKGYSGTAIYSRHLPLNVAHREIDIKNPAANRRNAGFTDEEREKFSTLLETGFTDTWRTLHPDEVKYSWWSYRFRARENNAGWRIDYFLVSDALKGRIESADIHNEIFGSDHCPVELVLR